MQFGPGRFFSLLPFDMDPLQPLPFLDCRFEVQHFAVLQDRISEVEVYVFGKVESQFAVVLFGVGIGQSEAHEPPPAYFQIFGLPLYKSQIEFVFGHVQLIERRQSFPKLPVV